VYPSRQCELLAKFSEMRVNKMRKQLRVLNEAAQFGVLGQVAMNPDTSVHQFCCFVTVYFHGFHSETLKSA
jgi:hypothetical protein